VLRFAKPRELVEEFGSTHMLVTVEDPEAGRAVAAWAEAAGFGATAEDGAVRVHGARVQDVLPALSRHCQDAGVAISGVSTAMDSLEKVFLRMTENEG
jgi:ABC-2 type transport system ATP-binding protein